MFAEGCGAWLFVWGWMEVLKIARNKEGSLACEGIDWLMRVVVVWCLAFSPLWTNHDLHYSPETHTVFYRAPLPIYTMINGPFKHLCETGEVLSSSVESTSHRKQICQQGLTVWQMYRKVYGVQWGLREWNTKHNTCCFHLAKNISMSLLELPRHLSWDIVRATKGRVKTYRYQTALNWFEFLDQRPITITVLAYSNNRL